ncbi:MAG: family 20 glycosylhydrolase [Candidatus Microbacterium stercoravium]
MVPALIPWPTSLTLTPGELRAEPAGSRAAAAAALARAGRRTIDAPGHGAEGYALRVTPAGVEIDASSEAGAFYAEQTLAQLVERDDDGFFAPLVDIRDEPRFSYRGLMLDVARNFHDADTVITLIERAAALKFNVLHLHLTDDQGWRIALEQHPELTAHGSSTSMRGGPGGFFARDDMRRIFEAAERVHVTVVPEIDVPGHTHALGLSHPELVADPVIGDEVVSVTEAYGGDLPRVGAPYTGFGVGFSSLRADAPGTEPLLRDVFGEVAAMTPGPYLHFGGDEALGTAPDDYRAMVSLAARIVADTGKTPVAWHEAGEADLPAGSVVQFWGLLDPEPEHVERVTHAVAQGARVILSPADAIYLDMKYDETTPTGLTWANGPTSVERSYVWDPGEIIPGLADGAVLGVEAALWTETIADAAAIETMVFPRLASAAEAAWSAPLGTVQREWAAFRDRLGRRGPAWRESGIRFHPSPEVAWAQESSYSQP